jgi:hypothetical protein
MTRDLDYTVVFREKEIKKEGIQEEVYIVNVDETDNLLVYLTKHKNEIWEETELVKCIELTNFEEGIEWIQKISKMSYEEFKLFLA